MKMRQILESDLLHVVRKRAEPRIGNFTWHHMQGYLWISRLEFVEQLDRAVFS